MAKKPKSSDSDHIDRILSTWSFDPSGLSVRMVKGNDGRDVLQMRIDMGILQLELDGRPDGAKQGGFPTMLDKLRDDAAKFKDEFVLDDDMCNEIDREFVQYYHRRICWLRLQEYVRAVADADHTLALMDFSKDHSHDEHWTISHEQYRPFVLFHRTQAAALAELSEKSAEAAIEAITNGLDRMRTVFVEYEADDHFEEDELVGRLMELRESLRKEYEVGRTLLEQLADAVAAEQYELAAKLRDELAQRQK